MFALSLLLWGVQGCLSSSTPARGGLRGVVTDVAGKRLSGVKVTAGGASTYTDVAGVFALDDLEPQFYSVLAEKEGYESQSREVEVLSGAIVENLLFALLEKGDLYGLTVTDVTSSGANVVFYTKNPATGWLEYGPNTLYETSTPPTASGTMLHQFTLTNLTPATTYHVRGRATDHKGRSLTGAGTTFTTAATARGNPPTGLTARKEPGVDAVVVSWAADTAADLAGYRLYRATSAGGPFTPVDTGPTRQTTYIDTVVTPGEKVYYRVTRVAGSGEESPPSPVVAFLLPGTTRVNLVWTPENNPYELTGDLWIRDANSLTIMAGVVVKVAASDSWDADPASDRKVGIKVSGTLIVQGEKTNPVTITSAAGRPAAGDWAGITFDALANLNTSRLTGLNLSFARDGVHGERGVPPISDSTFAFCSESGIECRAARTDVRLTGVTADSCTSGFLLASNTGVLVRVASCTALRCFYGIVSRDNGQSEIIGNKVQFWSVSGLDLGNTAGTALASRNVVAPGSNGTAVVLRGNDELRRNTLQGQIGVEIRGDARAIIRSNLILADQARNAIGVFYNGNALYVAASHTIDANDVWNLPSTDRRRYIDASGNPLTGIGNPWSLDPQLAGGNPFVEFPSLNFDYRPVGNNLKGKGYAGEDIGAYDVP